MADNVNLLNLADQVKTWANRHQFIVELAAALESIGSLEQARAESESRLAKVREEIEVAAADWNAANDSAAKVKAEVEAIRKAALDEAGQVKADAYAAAMAMRGEAEHTAATVVESARAQAERQLADAQSKAQDAEARVGIARDDLAEIVSQRDAARVELDEINARIGRAKAEAKRLLEG